MKKLFWIIPALMSIVFIGLYFFRKNFVKPVVDFDEWEVL